MITKYITHPLSYTFTYNFFSNTKLHILLNYYENVKKIRSKIRREYFCWWSFSIENGNHMRFELNMFIIHFRHRIS